MPKGYMIADLEVTNEAGFEAYRSKVSGTIAAYGGRYLVRGGDPKLVEGSVAPPRMVVVEFDSAERAMEWYNSREYQAILPDRLRNSTARLVCTTGA